MYDLDNTVDSKLANISTRGLVQTGDDVMIGGIIVLGPDPAGNPPARDWSFAAGRRSTGRSNS